jgi:hypothetical protein
MAISPGKWKLDVVGMSSLRVGVEVGMACFLEHHSASNF